MPYIAMRLPFAKLLIGATAALACVTLDAETSAQAGRWQETQWCVRAYDGADDCSYFTHWQCHTAVWGTGGSCVLNPHYAGGPERPYRKPRRNYR